MYLCALYFEIRSFLIIFHCDIGLLGVCQNRGSVRAAQGALASTTATAAKTSVLKCMNSRFFNLCRVYSNLLKMASVGEFPWS